LLKYIFFITSILCIAGHAQTAPLVGDASISKPWETTVYFTGGPAIAYKFTSPEEDYSQKLNIYNAGFSLGKVFLNRNEGRHVRGQFEYLAEIEPFWLGHFPKQNIHEIGKPPFSSFHTIFPSSNYHGIAVTPMLFRYRFPAHARFTPYVQLGGGLLYTFHDFPVQDSNRINFTPQADFGTHIATTKKQAIAIGLNVQHTSNAALGNQNPGVNVSILFRIGYTWWH
jgi:hypothetical protein